MAFFDDAKNGFIVEQLAKDRRYTLQLVTPEYMAFKESESTPVSKDSFQRRIAEMHGHLFFLIRIANDHNSGQLPDQVGAAAIYYSQAAAGDISLRKGVEVIHPSAYEFENNYGLAPYNTALVGFKVPDGADQEITIEFNDRFNNVMGIHGTYNLTQLPQVPDLK